MSLETIRLEMIQGMFDMVPNGYYAVRPDDTVPFTFVRIAKVRAGYRKGNRVVQTQHGEALKNCASVDPETKRWRIYSETIMDTLALIVADHQWAARCYAREIGKCCRCNMALTDERSRHYGIGPECEKVWRWMLEVVDLENDGLTYEELRKD